MSAQRWSQVRELLADLLEVPAEQRPALLDQRCEGDPELRAEVEDLLRAEDQITGFMEQGPALPMGVAGAPVVEARRLGPYRLLREVGHGGMGVVYLAERADLAFDKKVALKVLRRGLESADLVARFLRERQILARLEHPGIARLLDGGATEDGVPWLAMEYVEGVTIDAWCQQRGLDTEQRVRLFLGVCEAVEYAHRNLIVHRDIKPSNILITAEGVPKLLDFGIARIQGEGQEVTEPGVAAMTPLYASPEQVRGLPITTASDVYTLGVVLYELLTGRIPYPGPTGSRSELERAICLDPPEAPSASVLRGASPLSASAGAGARLARRLRGDLDTILLKTLAKDPGRRYLSVQQLSDDLRRHLDGLAVHARRDSALYRIGRFGRRNLPWVVGAVAFVGLLVLSVVVLGLQAQRLRVERDKAQAVATMLKGLFNLSDPNTSHQHDLTARELLDRSASRIGAEMDEQPELKAELLSTISGVYFSLAEYGRSEILAHQALAVLTSAGLERTGDAATIWLGLCRSQRERASWEEARSTCARGLALREELSGRVSLPAADARSALARVEELAGALERAEQLRRQVLAERILLVGEGDRVVALSYRELGVVLDLLGRLPEAEAVYRRALTTYERAGLHQDPELAGTLNNLAGVLLFQGKFDAAAQIHDRALMVRRQALGPDHPLVARSLVNVGWVEAVRGHRSLALERVEQARALRERVFGADHPDTLRALGSSIQLRLQGRDPTAVGDARRLLEARSRRLGPAHPETVQAHAIVGMALFLAGEEGEAEATLRAAVALQDRVVQDRSTTRAWAWLGLGMVLRSRGRTEEAMHWYTRALEHWETFLLDNHFWRAWAQLELARCHRDLGDEAHALELLARAGSYIERWLPPEDLLRVDYAAMRAAQVAPASVSSPD